MRLTLTLAASALFATSALAGDPILIIEVDADQTGTDAMEYLELVGPGNASLDDFFVLLYNGNSTDDAEYEVIDLDGQAIPADGYFVIGVPGVPNLDFAPSVLPATNAIQNGTDAVALWFDPTGTLVASDWFGTGPTTAPAGAVLVDAVVYDTSDADDVAMLAALGTGPQVNENENSAKDTESIGRCPDGGTAFDTASYATAAPTPGGPNTCAAANAWVDSGFALAGVNGDPVLVGTGDLSDGSANSVELSNAAASAVSGIFIGVGPGTPTNFRGGTLLPVPFLKLLFVNTNGVGGFTLPFVAPSGIPSGFEIVVQWAIQDGAAVSGVALSNAVTGTAP